MVAYKGKFGIDNEETNALAHELSNFIADLVDGANALIDGM